MVEFLPKESSDEWNTRHVEELCIHAGLIYIQKQKQKKPKKPKRKKVARRHLLRGTCDNAYLIRGFGGQSASRQLTDPNLRWFTASLCLWLRFHPSSQNAELMH
jgi:hypothetical protein